jgi:hypothetical protein
MLYVKETGQGGQEAAPGAQEADERAQARSKIWTPRGS